LRIWPPAQKRFYQKAYVTFRKIGFSQLTQDVVMPIGEKAVTEAFPNAQNKPRKKRYGQTEEVQFSRFRKNPTKKIEKDKPGMKENKKPIGKIEPEIFQGHCGFDMKIATI
jgi:hypothetical protein